MSSPRAVPARRPAVLRQWLSIPADRPALLQAQHRAFTKQMPLLYAMLLINMALVVLTHVGTAPRSLTLAFPLALTLVCGVRLIYWWRSRTATPDAERACRDLNRTNRLAALLATGFVAWGLLLFPHGSPLQQAHVAFFIAITMLGCIVFLLHLRQAMVAVAVFGNLGFVGFFAATGVPTFVAMAINAALVTLALLFVLLGHYRDFTQLVEARVQAEQLGADNLRLAKLDSLTQLPNRRGFFAQLEHCCAHARHAGRRVAVGILDLDGFKPVNDLYGHAAGDHLLTQVGQRLQALAGAQVFLARLGGDEFALIFDDCSDDELIALGQRACSLLRQPFDLGENTLQVAASMGLATYPDLADNATDLYAYADYALYHGKRSHRGSATLFSRHHRERIQLDATLEQALRQSDLERELAVVFQPIVDAEGRHTLAFEALARWHSPGLGAVAPAHFIPVAERSGLISLLTHVLLKKALAAALHWPAPVRLSFNLSAHDLGAPEVVSRLVDLIAASGFPPSRLELEITETAIMYDLEQVRWAVRHLRSLGCGMTLDDFGTGFSSFTQLHSLPLTKMKIDRSFVAGIQDNAASYKIVKSLLALCRDMDLDCVVEGVETGDELAVIRALGGRMVQGYLWARPMSLLDTGPWLAARPARAEVAHAVTTAAAPKIAPACLPLP